MSNAYKVAPTGVRTEISMKEKRKNRLSFLAFTLAAVAVLYLVLALVPRESNYGLENTMKKDGDMPILIAHGGGNKEFPDNTLEAFYNAYSVDKNVMMETDVSITKDGVVILSHDTTLDRKTNVTGKISEWNYSDLISQKVNFGYTNKTNNGAFDTSSERELFKNENGTAVMPTDVEYPAGVTPRDESIYLATTLEELIVSFPENRINVEIKQEGELGKRAFYEVIRLLTVHNAFDRVVLASFHPEIYDEFKKYQESGDAPACFMYSPATSGATKYFILHLIGLDLFFTDKMCVFQLPTEELGFNLATKRLVDNAHSHNLAVHYWTVNDVEEMKYLIEIGADGIMTDYPHRLKDVYDSYRDGSAE